MIIFNIRQKLFKQLSAKLAFIVVNFTKISKKKNVSRKKRLRKKSQCKDLNSKIETS